MIKKIKKNVPISFCINFEVAILKLTIMQKHLLFTIITLLSAWQVASAQLLPIESDFTKNSRKIYQLFFTLDEAYIEELHFFNLTEQTIKNIFSNLDPYAIYLTKEEVAEVKQSYFSAEREKFNGDFAFITHKELLKLKAIKSTKDDYLASFLRDGDLQTESSIDVAYKLRDSIGYVKVNRFSSTTASELESAITKLGKIKGLILDLRGNGGGFFNQGVATVDLFLPPGKIISYTEGRKVTRDNIMSKSNGIYETGKLVVIVDEMTASASELVAGALQDWDRATIIGHSTFGKGVVQQQIEFEDGSAMRVTIARYHTPTGRVIQRPYNLGIYGRKAHQVDTSSYLSLVKKRVLKAEGGIKPDIEIERDTSDVTYTWIYLIESGKVLDKLTSYIDKNEKDLKSKYPSVELFAKTFTIPTTLLEDILSGNLPFAITRSQVKMDKIRKIASGQLQAAIAEKVWGSGSYYKVVNVQSDNKYIAKALETLK